ncbi:MAG: TrkA family potassium uptake protein [Sedimentisphaerales bacterium]|nr:TrkA family potassium uptake protein [Sedimentisphaerales bacterium]
MYIIVAGGGLVGGALIRKLIDNKHDVILIEQNPKLSEKMYAETGVVAITGSTSQIDILREAKIDKADILVAATASDADNLTAAIMAKSFNVPKVIVRMRDPSYENAYKVAGANVIVHVTDVMSNQMLLEIEKPNVQKVTSIGSGKADIFRVVVSEGSKAIGKTIKDITSNPKFPAHCTFIAVYNPQKDVFTITRGGQVIEEGDEWFLIAPVEDINEAAAFLTDGGKK